jgi:hypothetical protein
MDSRTRTIRVAYVLAILIFGVTLVFHARRLVAPLAVCVLPSETAEARYTKSRVEVKIGGYGDGDEIRSEISYAGHKATLLTKRPLTQLYSGNEAERFGKKPEPEPTFTVRYVRWLPFLVVPDGPGATLGSYYRDTCGVGAFAGFVVYLLTTVVIAAFFVRHLRHSRLEREWDRDLRER